MAIDIIQKLYRKKTTQNTGPAYASCSVLIYDVSDLINSVSYLYQFLNSVFTRDGHFYIALCIPFIARKFLPFIYLSSTPL